MLKSPKQLPSCPKISETIVNTIIPKGVLYHVRAYTDFASYRRSTGIEYEKSIIISWLSINEVYFTPLLALKITQLQDKIIVYIF